jgi:hypothetical protein
MYLRSERDLEECENEEPEEAVDEEEDEDLGDEVVLVGGARLVVFETVERGSQLREGGIEEACLGSGRER